MAGAVGMPYRKFLLCNAAGALVWATTMVSLAWLGGRWIPFQSMAKGVVEFGLGALVLVVLLLLIPRLMSRLEDKSKVKHGEICEPVAETGESL
jgi:membrane protein DedA with SNARE-associated domain